VVEAYLSPSPDWKWCICDRPRRKWTSQTNFGGSHENLESDQ
jgi:hypothetical protein